MRRLKLVTRKEANNRAHRESPGAIAANRKYHRDVMEPKRALIGKYVTAHPEEVEEIRERNVRRV